ncbi:MAG: helix-turn-helix domain-containing protein [Bacteroidales bacterium]|nr:helix-turn-helix domain-containing protein [Bacteroidales bacterium]
MDVVSKKTVAQTPLEDWIDNYDVMAMLRVSFRTLQTLRTAGLIPYSRFGRKVYYRKADIQKLLADNYKMNTIRFDYGKPIIKSK